MNGKETFPTALSEGVKTKTNYNLVGLIVSALVVGFVSSCLWLSSPLDGILAVVFAISIVVSPFWVPRMMKQMPPSEQHILHMAKLGYYEIDGKLIAIENQHSTVAQNPRQLPPAPPKAKEDVTKE